MRSKLGSMCTVGAFLLGLALPAASRAQQVTSSGRVDTPSTVPSTWIPANTSGAPALRRTIALNLDDVSVKDALQTIGKQARLEINYGEDVLSATERVSLQSDSIAVRAALTEALRGTGLQAYISATGSSVLVRAAPQRSARPVRGRAGSVSGTVTDAKTGSNLVGADVSLEGTRWRSSTGENGRYQLSEVEPGSYTLVVRRIGYRRESRAVTVRDGEAVTVDVALEAVPTRLDEVVTTVTGEQRLRELGHVVGRINADSLVREAPVSSVTELLNARVPGLQVFTGQGTVGGSASLRIRGTTSLELGLEPIVIVDGVRYAGGNGDLAGTGPAQFRVEATSRLNDLNPNDIESIEVVKGPSAATLYGQDAANGVIVITTKRGRAGPARWNAYAKGATTDIPNIRYGDIYWGWSSGYTGNCSLRRVADGVCVQDSVTVLPNPLNDSQLTLFGSSPRWEYGANVSGGSESLRYYFSADLEDATGPVRLPAAVVKELEAERGVRELPEELREPNAFTKFNLRSNVSAELGQAAELRANVGYTQSSTRALALNNPYNLGATTPTDPYVRTPRSTFARTSTEYINRFFGSANGTWRMAPWLLTRATVGLDLTSSYRYSLARRGEAEDDDEGRVGDDRTRTMVTTAELGGTATFGFGRLSSRTSVGAQYVRYLGDGVATDGSELPPGGASIAEAEDIGTSHSYRETVTLGSYVEQTFGLNDRLFLTGALRVDGASTFGRGYDAAVYPKAGVSWILSEEPFVPRLPGLDELRLRYSYGAAGRHPTPAMTLGRYLVLRRFVDGELQNTVVRTRLGSPSLRPERVKEHEFGLDAGALDGRLQLNLTWNRRRAIDQITTISMPPGLGSLYANFGLITDRGFEAQVTARVLDTPALSWDMMLTHASNANTLVDLGNVGAFYSSSGSFVEGYPVGARFADVVVGVEDMNGDGIIVADEVQVSDTAVYLGRSTPARTQTLSGVLGLFQQRLRVSALLERRAGFMTRDMTQSRRCSTLYELCRVDVVPGSPLAAQAEKYAPNSLGFQPGDFTRLREVSVALELPDAWARAMRVGRMGLSLSGRNLALWTDYDGPDPESAEMGGTPSSSPPTGIPQGRTWILRLDVGF